MDGWMDGGEHAIVEPRKAGVATLELKAFVALDLRRCGGRPGELGARAKELNVERRGRGWLVGRHPAPLAGASCAGGLDLLARARGEHRVGESLEPFVLAGLGAVRVKPLGVGHRVGGRRELGPGPEEGEVHRMGRQLGQCRADHRGGLRLGL